MHQQRKLYLYCKTKVMEINWAIIGIVVAVLIVLIVFMIKKNQKEKKKLTEFLNNDFKRVEEDEPDVDDTANER